MIIKLLPILGLEVISMKAKAGKQRTNTYIDVSMYFLSSMRLAWQAKASCLQLCPENKTFVN